RGQRLTTRALRPQLGRGAGVHSPDTDPAGLLATVRHFVFPRRTLLVLLALVCALPLALPATSGAYVVGVADQSPALFTNQFFEQLAPTRTRYITAIDSVFKQRDL